MTDYEKVQEFAKKFNLPTQHFPSFPGMDDMLFRISRQEEECHELRDAWDDGDLTKAFDALLDAAYIIYGTAIRMGITPEMWAQGFDVVHTANMRKVRADKASQSKYRTTQDIIKPPGWVGPEEALRRIIGD